jgi:hypothetical protein
MSSAAPLHLRFFISSPGDVADERKFAQRVIEQELPKDPLLRGRITCEAVLWDDEVVPVPMVATQGPQQSVDQRALPSQCDVVIVILWSRLGSRPGDSYRRADGTPCESGTEWEFEEAVAADPPPHVLVYQRTSPVPFSADDPLFDEKTEQLRKLRGFLGRFEKQDGVYRRGLNRYESPQQFHDRLATDLRAYIQQVLDRAPQPIAAQPARTVPYAAIARALAAGELVPFIGPGVLASHGRPGAPVDPSAPRYLPSSAELSELLAGEAGLPKDAEHGPLAEVASYYEAKGTRVMLRESLRRIFGGPAITLASIPPLYTALASLATRRKLLILTTNFDTLLERSFLAPPARPYDLVIYPAEKKDLANAVLWWKHGETAPRTPAPNELDIDLSSTTVIFKMHGTIQPDTDQWDGTVITESDYVDFLSRVGGKSAIPSVLSAHLRDRALLFLGFGLRDWASRTILRRMKWRSQDEDDETPSWAIASTFTPMELLLWTKRSVHPIEVDLDEFARGLQAQLTPP